MVNPNTNSSGSHRFIKTFRMENLNFRWANWWVFLVDCSRCCDFSASSVRFQKKKTIWNEINSRNSFFSASLWEILSACSIKFPFDFWSANEPFWQLHIPTRLRNVSKYYKAAEQRRVSRLNVTPREREWRFLTTWACSGSWKLNRTGICHSSLRAFIAWRKNSNFSISRFRCN